MQAELPWGYCGSPLLVDDRIVVQPGGPQASWVALAPDMSTPVVVGHRVFCVHGMLHCLDLENELRPLYRQRDPALGDYGSLIADQDRVLVIGNGQLLLIDARSDQFRLTSRLQVFDDEAEIFSHPALVGDRLYLRGSHALRCVSLEP